MRSVSLRRRGVILSVGVRRWTYKAVTSLPSLANWMPEAGAKTSGGR